MKVYILFESHWATDEGEEIINIYFSKEKAEEECKKLNKDDDVQFPFFIEEHEVIE